MAMRSNFKGALLFLVLATKLVVKSSGVTYVVGDALGWKIPTAGAATYSSWAAQHTFLPGDKLVFNFTIGAHDVAMVDQASFDSCGADTTSTSSSVSPATVTLSSAGHQYFICTIGQHCSLGQKLSVKVLSIISPPPLSLQTSPPAPAPILKPTQTPVAFAPAPAQSPASASILPTLPSSASPPAPFVPEAPLSPLSEGVPSPTGSFPGIGMGPGSFPFPPQNSATTAANWRVLFMIISAAIGLTLLCAN